LIYNPITVVVVVGLGPAVSQQSCFDRFVQERLDGAQKSIFGGVFIFIPFIYFLFHL
jgi:hypothetical protein